MVSKFCSRSQGQPVTGVRSAAMISIRRLISLEGCMMVSIQRNGVVVLGGLIRVRHFGIGCLDGIDAGREFCLVRRRGGCGEIGDPETLPEGVGAMVATGLQPE